MDNQDLYQQVIIDHSKSPRHFQKLENATNIAAGKNPVCGDDVTVYIQIKDDMVEKITFDGSGCAICMASASLMSEALEGKTKQDVIQKIESFLQMLTKDSEQDYELELGKCSILNGIKHYPLRIKCATLGWHALKAAVTAADQTVSTE